MLLASAAGACSTDFSRISEGDYTAAVARQRAFLRQPVRQPMPQPMHAGPAVNKVAPVAQEPIGSDPTMALEAPYRPTPQNMARVSYGNQPALNEAPSSALLASQQGNWTSIGGTTIQVAPGETGEILSRRYGVPEKAILQANGYKTSAEIVAGRSIIIPTYVYGAPAAAGAESALASQTEGRSTLLTPPSTQPAYSQKTPLSTSGRYKVVSGDTLYGIARQNGVSVSALSAANGLSNSSTLRIGQELVIPDEERIAAQSQENGQVQADQQAKQDKPTVKPSETTLAQAAKPAEVQNAAYAPPSLEAARPEAGEPSQALSFRWPVRGRVLSTFGDQINGERNDGVNLAVPEGTAVKSAEKGVVIYAGNELKSYGNLVLVRHADNWVTAYAHNSKLLVSRGDQVSRGQDIALAGATGSVTSPQLRFEIRKGSAPVNPLNHLGGV